LLITLDTKKVKPSQRCPQCGVVPKEWAELSNRYHICNDCRFEIERDKGSVMVMYNVATNQQQGLGTSLSDVGLSSSTSSKSKRKHTGSMKQRRHCEASKILPSSRRGIRNPVLLRGGVSSLEVTQLILLVRCPGATILNDRPLNPPDAPYKSIECATYAPDN
jgi:putative transposase